MSADRGVIAVIESQLSNFGLTPLRAAHELGYRTVLVSNDPDRYRRVSNAEQIFAEHLDEMITTDTNSVDTVHTALRRFHEGGSLRGITTVTDYNLVIVAELAARFGLPGLSADAAGACRDKLLMRRACAAADVPVPGFKHATTVDEALVSADAFGYPCVVKPMTESASIGVTLCATPEDVRSAYLSISSVSTNFRGQARRPGALVEEYLVGFEVSVESVLVDGKRDFLGLTDKALGPHPHFVEMGDTFPSMLSKHVREQCVEIAQRALDAVGHDFGAAHVEVKVTSDGLRIVEVNGRMAGAEIPQLIRAATGVYLQREVVRLHAGEVPDLSRSRERAAASRYLAAGIAGTLRTIDGVDLAHRIPGVVEVDLEAHPGDQVRPPESNLDLLGYVVAVGDSTGDAVRRAESALGQLAPRILAPSERTADVTARSLPTVAIQRTIADLDSAAWDAQLDERGFYSATPWLRHAEATADPPPFYFVASVDSRVSGVLPAYPLDAKSPYIFCRSDRLVDRIHEEVTGVSAPWSADLMPTLACGGRNPAHTKAGVSDRLDAGLQMRTLRAMVDATESTARTHGLRSVSYLYVDEDDVLLSTALQDAGYVAMRCATAYSMELAELGSFEDYLARFDQRRRNKIKRELRMLDEAGIRYRTERLTDELVGHIAPLEMALYAKHGTPAKADVFADVLRSIGRNAPQATRVVTARLQGKLCGFVLLFTHDREMYARQAGFDYDLKGKLPVYFGLLYYQLVRVALAEGVRQIHYSIGSGNAKLSRGCTARHQVAYLKGLDSSLHARLARLAADQEMLIQ